MDKPNIIWFMIDSMRNEFLNEFGFDTERNFIDELISQGVAFTNCHSVAPFTVVSMGAKLTGCLPSVSGLDGWLKKDPMKAINRNCINMIDVLKYNGYYNTLYSDSPGGIYLPPEGFDIYHIQDGHDFPLDDYVNHEGPKFTIIVTDIIHDACCKADGNFTKKDFAARIKETGDVLKSYYDRIKSDNDIILITSDHGLRCKDDFEGKRYSAEYTTGRYLTEKTTRASFNIIWKNKLNPMKLDCLCRTIDIMPTFFDIIGFEYPKASGISLKKLLNGEMVEVKYAYSITGWSVTHPFSAGAWCVKNSRYKLVEYEEKNGLSKIITTALYDYIFDKEETENLIDKYPEVAKELKQELHKQLKLKSDVLDLYAVNGFDNRKYLESREKNKNQDVVDYVQNRIVDVWQNKTRKMFLRRYFLSEIKRLFYYYLFGKIIYKY